MRTFVEQQVGTDPLQRVNFGYDSVDQLTSEVSTETPLPDVNTTYAYDAMGNRTQAQDSVQQTSYSSNRLNQVTGYTTTNLTTQATGSTTLGYDLDGNLTQQGSSRYGYDDANRLTSIVRVDAGTGANLHKSEFVYDGLSRRRISREYDWNNGAWELQSEVRRIYDGMNVVQERDANNAVIATYTRGKSMGGGIGGLLARSTAQGHFYYHYDGRGNVTQLTDANQTTVARYTYGAFGNTHATGSQAGQPYRFSTKEQHSYSGLYDYGYRFYSPGLGRWINRDPIDEQGGLNLYGFVGNSPIGNVDPDGRLHIVGGALLGGILSGAGAIAGGASWCAAGVAASVGALAGGLTAFLAPLGPISVQAFTLIGAVQGALQSLFTNLICDKCKDWKTIGLEAIISAGVGSILGAVGGIAADTGLKNEIIAFAVQFLSAEMIGGIGGITSCPGSQPAYGTF